MQNDTRLQRALAWVKELKERIWSAASKTSVVLVGLFAFVVVLVMAQEDFFTWDTYGSIWVDSPEIYTRERLVNDRFLQDAWLTQQLSRLDREKAGGPMALLDERQTIKLKGGASNPAPATEGEKPAATAQSDGKSADRVFTSPRDRLTDEVDYRDYVRNLMIENQLDDRHDLNGNALYRLKFDTTVVPGQKTRSQAEIRVYLRGPLEPPTPEARHRFSKAEAAPAFDPAVWRPVYLKWLESLSTRLNQTHKELKQVYINNEFSHNDYARLIEFLSSNRAIALKGVKDCPANLTDIKAQSDRLLQLKPEDHVLRKKCVVAILETRYDRDNAQTQGAQVSGSYPTFGIPPGAAGPPPSTEPPPGAPGPAPQAAPSPPTTLDPASLENAKAHAVARQLEHWLNGFFASKAVQLVLGIVVPESSFAGETYVNIPALKPLINLTFFNPQLSTQDGNVFNVQPKVFLVTAIDKAMTQEEFNKRAAEQGSALHGRRFDDFKDPAVSNPALRVSEPELKPFESEKFPADTLKFERDKRVKGVHTADAEVGLFNFAEKAAKNTRAFTYAVTPKESADTTLATQMAELEVNGLLRPSAGGEQDVQGTLKRQAAATALNRQGRVVGFGSATKNEGEAVFGWVVGPRRLVGSAGKLVHVHSPAQYSMSALVSIPSWWNTLRLEVMTSWINEDGTRSGRRTTTIPYTIEVPTDFEPLEATLLQVQQLGPELMESRLDPILLTACREGSIVIPGRRLWRSTVVTLGYQPADEISVLPNMKGIIAKFKLVDNQMSQREAVEQKDAGQTPPEIQRAVRVWTSQGAIALPIPARIGIPAGCEQGKK